MFCFRQKKLMVVAVCLCFSFSLFGGRILKIGYHEFFPELYTGDDGRATGRICDNIRATAERAGYQVVFSALPEKRIYHMLIRGRLDGWFGTTTVPFLQGETVNAGILDTKTLRSYFIGETEVPTDDEQFFIEKNVVIVKGHSYGRLGEFLRKESSQVELLEVKTTEDGLKVLQEHSSQYFLDYKSNVENVTRATGIAGMNFKDVGVIGFTLLSPKIVKNSRKIVHRFSKAWKELEREGKIK